MIQQYVTFLFPGSLFPNERSQKISNREEKFDIPNGCFAYYFWERQETELNGEILYSDQRNKSGRFYFGKAMTAQEIEATIPDADILLKNMKYNNWLVVVKTRVGNFQPLMENDTIVAE